jgi:hypothetical protein
MKTITNIETTALNNSATENSLVDTTFVLFFLAVEFGQTLTNFGLDSICLALALMVVAIFPYFLPSGEKSSFGNWLLGRGFIVSLAITLGVAFKQSLGGIIPETFRFLPMTFLIVTSMVCCFLQFYGFFKFRDVK